MNNTIGYFKKTIDGIESIIQTPDELDNVVSLLLQLNCNRRKLIFRMGNRSVIDYLTNNPGEKLMWIEDPKKKYQIWYEESKDELRGPALIACPNCENLIFLGQS
jgi:hypothetical protein